MILTDLDYKFTLNDAILYQKLRMKTRQVDQNSNSSLTDQKLAYFYSECFEFSIIYMIWFLKDDIVKID